jgi:hypothetical protein
MRRVPRRVDKWRYNADLYIQVSNMDATAVTDDVDRVNHDILPIPWWQHVCRVHEGGDGGWRAGENLVHIVQRPDV